MPVDANQIQSIAQAAAQTPIEERAKFLEQACGNDSDLRQRVEALLKAPGTQIDESAALETANFPYPPPPKDPSDLPRWSQAFTPAEVKALPEETVHVAGMRIGPYKLLEPIGEGGMGTVWMAEQVEPVKRMVALKVIKPGMDSNQILARFEAERQAIAMMDHPHIAKVLDAGATATGRPFFVMELVKGVPITKYCDDHQLTLRQRLELFIPVCQAIQHAHQKGIIHRDIKPSNVLVASYDGKPVPKVIDFGVAKATGEKLTERTMYTGFGAIVGTLEYMSPEQAEFNALDIDTRSDIYALGVLLYELMTGTTPLTWQRLRQATIVETLRMIREEDPPLPSARLSHAKETLSAVAGQRQTDPVKLAKMMRGELDWLVMKALEKDRDRRYETANSMAQDVQRFLDDEPVLARPPSAIYLLRKFAKRNKRSLIAATVILLALVGGIIGTTWGLVEARQQRDEAEHARIEEIKQRLTASDQRDRAVKAERDARDNEQKALQKEAEAKKSEEEQRAVLSFFQNHVLAAARPKGLQGALGIDASIRDALDAAEPKIAAAFDGKPMAEAAIRNSLGTTYANLGDFKKAIPQHEKAWKLLQGELGAGNADTLRILNNLASDYRAAGRLGESLKFFEQGLALCKTNLGADDTLTLIFKNNLAYAYQAADRLDAAIAMFEEIFHLRQNTLGLENADTLVSMNNLANAYQLAGKSQDALPLLEQALDLSTTIWGPEHPETLQIAANLGESYRSQKRGKDASPLLEKALSSSKTVCGPDHPITLILMTNLAKVYEETDKLPEALKLFEEELKLCKAKVGTDHPDTLISLDNLAAAYWKANRIKDAVPLYEEKYQACKTKFGPDDGQTFASISNLGWAYLELGQYAQALKVYSEGVKFARPMLGTGNARTQDFISAMAMCHEEMNQWDKAEPLWRELVSYWQGLPKQPPQIFSSQLAALANNLLKQGKYVEAEPLLRDCLALRGKEAPEGWPTFNAMSLLGGSLLGQKKYTEAEPLLLKGYEGMNNQADKMGTRAQAFLVNALQRIVELYEVQGEKSKAEEWRKKLAAREAKKKKR